MSASVKFKGLAELYANLRKLPEELRDEARQLVEAKGQRAKNEIDDAYPEVTGALKRGLSVEVVANPGNYGARVIVRNRAKHAFLFENGTQTRKNSLGQNRGKPKKPGRVFVPIMIRMRRELREELKALVERAGLDVRGDE